MGGNVTTDKVFLLSFDDVCQYFGDSTTNLKEKGGAEPVGSIDDRNNIARVAKHGSEGASWWWLRTPGQISSRAVNVNSDGSFYVNGFNVHTDSGGVRPALWLNL
jgi:hypothetical protein